MTAIDEKTTKANEQPHKDRDMLAVTQRAYGSADVLNIERVPRPEIDDDEVLIEVVATGLDRGVWHLMSGEPYLIRMLGYGLTKPKNPVLGLDVSGRVVKVGADVTRFSPGDEVFGIAKGSFAEFATAKEEKLAIKPAGVSFEHAGAATVSGITALQALAKVGELEEGQRVLVIGASGGVGSFAVQIAKAMGATVTGVASTAKLDFVRELGADDVVDYTRDDVGELEDRFDLIIDIGGRNTVKKLRRVLTPAGTLVLVGGEAGGKIAGGIGRQIRAALTSLFVRQRLAFFISEESREYIEPLAEHMAAGEVIPAIGHRFTLEEVPAAMHQLEAGQLKGKAVITIGQSDDA